MSGTGMPSLAANAQTAVEKPVISSNLCLAANLLVRSGHGELVEDGYFITGWRLRLAEAS